MRSDYAVYDLALRNQKRAPKNAVLPGIPVLHPVHRTMVEVAVGHKDEVSGQVIGVAAGETGLFQEFSGFIHTVHGFSSFSFL